MNVEQPVSVARLARVVLSLLLFQGERCLLGKRHALTDRDSSIWELPHLSLDGLNEAMIHPAELYQTAITENGLSTFGTSLQASQLVYAHQRVENDIVVIHHSYLCRVGDVRGVVDKISATYDEVHWLGEAEISKEIIGSDPICWHLKAAFELLHSLRPEQVPFFV